MESSEQNDLLEYLLAFDSKGLETDLDYVRAALDSLETIYSQDAQNSFEYASRLVCIIVMTVHAFVESYAKVLSTNKHKKSDYVLPMEIVSQNATSALKAFFDLVKLAIEARFNPRNSITRWTEVKFGLGTESLALQSRLHSRLR